MGLSLGVLGVPHMVDADATTLRFSWWGTKARHEVTLKALGVIKRKLPGVEVKPTYSGFAGYFDKLATQTAGGGAPDVFGMLDWAMREYSSRKALLDLSQFTPKTLNLEGWDEGLVKTGKVDDKLYGVPAGVNAFCYYYDKTALDNLKIQMPDHTWTWDDFRTLATGIAKAGAGNYYGAEDMGGDFNHFEVFVRQRKKQFFGQNGLGFEKQDLIDWWSFWRGLSDAGAIVPFSVQAESQTFETSPFFTGKAAMRSGYPDQYVNIQGDTKHETMLTTVPNGPAGSTPGLYVRPSLAFSGFSKTDHPDTVAQFINLLVNDPDVVKVLGVAWGIQSNPKLRAEMQKTATPVEKRAYDYMQTVVENSSPPPAPPPQGANHVRDEFGRQYGEVGFGKTKVNDAVDHFFTAVKDMLT